jgi:hypothetical protein
MPRVRHFATALLVGASFFIAGCADSPTAPQLDDTQESYGLLSDLGALLGRRGNSEATVLERRRPLAHDEVVTETIGRWGGVMRLPDAGLTVYFPYGAVRRNTSITITAPAGNLVGYHFEPHGLEFGRPVTLVQDLLSTEGLGLRGMSAVYFDGELEPQVSVLERLPLLVLRILGIFSIEHFSGYVIATN